MKKNTIIPGDSTYVSLPAGNDKTIDQETTASAGALSILVACGVILLGIALIFL